LRYVVVPCWVLPRSDRFGFWFRIVVRTTYVPGSGSSTFGAISRTHIATTRTRFTPLCRTHTHAFVPAVHFTHTFTRFVHFVFGSHFAVDFTVTFTHVLYFTFTMVHYLRLLYGFIGSTPLHCDSFDLIDLLLNCDCDLQRRFTLVVGVARWVPLVFYCLCLRYFYLVCYLWFGFVVIVIVVTL